MGIRWCLDELYEERCRKEMVEGQNDHWKNVLVVAWTGTRGVIPWLLPVSTACTGRWICFSQKAFDHIPFFCGHIYDAGGAGTLPSFAGPFVKDQATKDAGSEDRELQ